jgi:hypothetical protein
MTGSLLNSVDGQKTNCRILHLGLGDSIGCLPDRGDNGLQNSDLVFVAGINDDETRLQAAVRGEHDAAVTPALRSLDAFGEIDFAISHGDSKTDIGIGITEGYLLDNYRGLSAR